MIADPLEGLDNFITWEITLGRDIQQRKRSWVCSTQTFSQSVLMRASPKMTSLFFEEEGKRDGHSRLFTYRFLELCHSWRPSISHTLLSTPPPNFRTNQGESETLLSKQSKIRSSVLWQDGDFLFPSPLLFLPPQAPCQPFLGGSLVKWRTVTVLSGRCQQ